MDIGTATANTFRVILAAVGLQMDSAHPTAQLDAIKILFLTFTTMVTLYYIFKRLGASTLSTTSTTSTASSAIFTSDSKLE